MSTVYPTFPKLTIKEGFDDEDFTDIDDEVFIKDGNSSSLKLDNDRRVKEPLMPIHRKCNKSDNFNSNRLLNRSCISHCSGLLVLTIILCLIVLCIYIGNIFPMSTSMEKVSLPEYNIVPCTSLETKILWSKTFPKLISESPLRSNDVNDDGIEDIIVGFSTGLDMTGIPEYVCTLYFNKQIPCFGGVLALNGATGDPLWIHWAASAIYSVNCELDLSKDKIKDCIVCGHGGIFQVINGYDGTVIWEIPIGDLYSTEKWKYSDVYHATFISDIDGDEVGDIIAFHTIRSREIHSSEILIMSGFNGNIIQSAVLHGTEQLFSAPQKLIHPDGESSFVIVTNANKGSAGLYVISQKNLMYGNLKLRKLHHSADGGTLISPILVDVTLDGIEDIVTVMFSSAIIVYNGLTFELVWNYTIPNSIIISVPIPGYYNDDKVPDFMVKYQIDSNDPICYYTFTTIVDGKTGKPLLEEPIESSSSKEISGLSVSVEGFGNDWFLHWSVGCLNNENVEEGLSFFKDVNVMPEIYADLCKLWFNSTMTINLYALSQHVGPPGVSLYFSENYHIYRKIITSLEYNNSMDSHMWNDLHTLNIFERSLKMDDTQENENTLIQKFKGEPNVINSNILTNENMLMGNNSEKSEILEEDQLIDTDQENTIWESKNTSMYGFTDLNHIANKITSIGEKENNSTTSNNRISIAEAINCKLKSSVQCKRKYKKKETMKKNSHTLSKSNKKEMNKKSKNVKQGSVKFLYKKSDINKNLKMKITQQRLRKREIKNMDKRVYPMHSVKNPTGLLLPSLSKSKGTTSTDLIFSKFRLPISQAQIMVYQNNLNCINSRRVQTRTSKHLKEEYEIIKKCLKKHNLKYEMYEEANGRENSKIFLGEMTIYRMKLKCTCPDDMLPNQSCKNVSQHQRWSEYLGPRGNGYFKTFYKINS